MADWYASSVAYAAIASFAISTAYTVGQIIKPTAPTAFNRHAFRCTTAGTTAATEPAWGFTNNSTTTSGSAVFTCVTGQSAYAWTAAGGDIASLTGDGASASRASFGDRLFVSSDHSETNANKTYFAGVNGTWSGSYLAVLSVNRAGSIPPVAADITPGATLISTATQMMFEFLAPIYIRGFNIQSTGFIYFNSSRLLSGYFRDCAFYLTGAGAGRISTNNPGKIIWENTTVQFNDVLQGIAASSYNFDLTWINTPSPLVGTPPTNLFVGGQAGTRVTCRGVDFSALTTGLLLNASGGGLLLLDSCRIAPGVIRLRGTPTSQLDVVELVNTYDGTNILNERYVAAGAVTTERTITLSGGATDDVGLFSHKMVSTTLIDRWVTPLEGFWLDIEQQSIGASRTATVEIISSAALNNDDISLLLEYQGTSGSSFASFGTTMPASVLTTPAAIATSTATWNASPATPVKQKLEVVFTPRVAGRVRGQVRLGKLSTTVYVNPVIAIA